MISTAFSTEPHYVQAVRGLLRMHELEIQGLGDSPQADTIRDALEGQWLQLTEEERNRLTGLSEDLYSLSEPSDTREMNAQAQRQLIEAYEARQAQNWDKALELLRSWGTHIDPALRAYLQGRTWLEAGDSATAAVFFQRASELEPENSGYRMIYLHALSSVDPSAADRIADEILKSCDRYSHDQIFKPLNIA